MIYRTLTNKPSSHASKLLSARRGRPSRTALHERLESEVATLKAVGGLPAPEEADEIWREIWYHEAHNSTAIEGNTLVLKQVEALLARGETVGGKELKEYLEVQGYASAAKWVYEQAPQRDRDRDRALMTLREIRNVHYEAMTPVWQVAPHPSALPSESPGNFREHDIRRFASGMQPPPHTQIHALMTDWVRQVNRLPTREGPVCESIAALHAAFERIHAFLDGNGRAGRLLLNLMLVRLGYPPAVIQKRERNAYLRALARSDRGDHGALGEIIARAVLDNLMRFLLPAIAGDVKLVPLEALADRDLSATALRQAAERGRLRATKDDRGTWRCSKKWVAEYKASRYSALRLPRKPRARSAARLQ